MFINTSFTFVSDFCLQQNRQPETFGTANRRKKEEISRIEVQMLKSDFVKDCERCTMNFHSDEE